MQKFLRTMMLAAALLLPLASQAQASADRTYLDEDFVVANPEGWSGGSSAYAPTFAGSGSPSWTYAEYALNGFAAGNYYSNLWLMNRYQWIISPEMDLTEAGQATLSFKLGMVCDSAQVDSGKTVMALVRTRATANAAWGEWTVLYRWVKSPAEGSTDLALDSLRGGYMDYGTSLNEVVGRYVQVAFYAENTTRNMANAYVHLDNVKVAGKIRAQAPTDVVAVEVGSTTVSLSWTDDVNESVNKYEVMCWKGTAAGDTLYAFTNGDAKEMSLSGLVPATRYQVRVRTYVDANTYGNWGEAMSFSTHYAAPVLVDAENTYTEDFENGAEGWYFVNAGATANGWYYSTRDVAKLTPHDAYSDTLGMTQYTLGTTYSLTVYDEDGEVAVETMEFDNTDDLDDYILTVEELYSEEDGYSLVTDTVEAWVAGDTVEYSDEAYAAYGDDDSVRIIVNEVPAGFDTTWNSVLWISNNGGASNAYSHSETWAYAYLPVQLVEGQYDLSFNWRNRGENNYDYAFAALIAEDAAINAGSAMSGYDNLTGNLSGQSDWQSYDNTFTVGSDGFYKFVLAWRNDGGGGSNPPASIDNIMLKKVVSYPVSELAVVDSLATANSVTVSWADELNAEGTTYLVTATLRDTVRAEVEVAEGMEATIEGLDAHTTYRISVYAIANDDVSRAASVNTTTNPNVFPVEDLVTVAGRTDVEVSWADLRNAEAEYIVMLKKGNDTIRTIEGAESGLTIGGLETETGYTVSVLAVHIDTAVTSWSFATTCPQASFTPANTYTIVVSSTYNYYSNYFFNNYGGYVGVEVGGIEKGHYTSTGTYQVEANEGEDVVLLGGWSSSWGSSYVTYLVVTISDAEGHQLYNGGLSTTNGATSFSVPQFSCIDPEMTVEVSERTQDGALVSWNNPMIEDAEDYVYVVRSAAATVDSQVTTGTSVVLSGLAASTAYTVQVTARYEDGYAYTGEAVAFETMGPCNAPDNLSATATHATIALTWEQTDATVQSYQLYYTTTEMTTAEVEALDADEFTEVTGNDGYTIVDLESNVTYYIYFRANCGENMSAWRTATAKTLPFLDCDDLAVNHSATQYNNSIPVSCYYKYGLTEMLVTSEELGDAKTLNSVTYYAYDNGSHTRNIDIYIQPYAGNNLSSSVNLNSETGVQVFSGNVTFSGATTIAFSTPYEYSGEDGIIVIVDDNTGSYTSNFNFVTGGTGMALYARSDDTDYNPAQATSYTGYSGMSAVTRPKMTFGYCIEVAACAAVSEIEVSDIDYNAANISWQRPDSKVVGYLLVYSAEPVTDFGTATAIELGDVTSYSFTGIEQNTTHYVYLATVCGEAEGDTSAYTMVSFETPAYCRVATDVEAETVGKNSAIVRWASTSETQAANYSYILDTVELSADSLANYAGTIVSGIAVDTVLLSGLEYEQSYYFYVRNVCELDGSDVAAPWAGPATFSTSIELPTVINLTTEVYRNQITAAWERNLEAFADEQAWEVSIRNAGDDSTDFVWESVSEMSKVFAGLDYATAYHIYVRPVSGENHGDSVMATATTGIQMPAVINLTAEANRDTIRAAWEKDTLANAIETQWQVALRHADDDSTALVWNTANEPSYVAAGVDYDMAYRVYVRAIDGDSMSDSVYTTVSTVKQMPAVVNVHVGQLSHNYAQVVWERGNQAIESQWAFGFKAAADEAYTWTVIDHMDTMIYGLDELTAYSVRIAALDNGLSSDSVNAGFNTISKEAVLSNCLEFEGYTSTSNVYPFAVYYNYGISQTIVKSDEIPSGNFKSIAFYSESVTATRNIKLWLQPTDKESFAGTSDWEALSSDAVLVYNGSYTFNTGWNQFDLETPYELGGKNLLVIAYDGTGTYVNQSFRTVSGESNTCLYYNNDYTNPSYNNPANDGTRTNYRPAMRFCYEGQYIQELEVNDITENSANASWMPGGHETSWEYVNAEGTMTDEELEAAEKTTVSEQQVALTGLTADRDYTFYIRANETTTDTVVSVHMVFDSIHTWFDTTYSKENPLEMVVITNNDTVLKVQYDTTYASHLDTVTAEVEGMEAVEVLKDSEDNDSAWVYSIADTTTAIHYDTTYIVHEHSDWCSVEYTTPGTCEMPQLVAVDGITTNSAVAIAMTEAAGMNFRLGTEEIDATAGVMFDTTDIVYVYDTIEKEYWYTGYIYYEEDDEYEYHYSFEPFEGYHIDEVTGEYVSGIDSVLDYYELSDEAIDTLYSIDTISYFYAELTDLEPATTYTVAAQSVCGEGSESRWMEYEFTTEAEAIEFECGDTLEVPFEETFDAASLTAECWNVIVLDTFTSVEYEITNGQLYPAGNNGDHSYIPTVGNRYDRVAISPVFTAGNPMVLTSYLKVNRYYESSDIDVARYMCDSVAVGYSTTGAEVEDFTWSDMMTRSGNFGSQWTNQNLLPADAKYVAYHFVGEKPDWMSLEGMTLAVADSYSVKAYNANEGMGEIVMTVNGDTVEVEAYPIDETVYTGQTVVLREEPNHGYHFNGWERIDANNHRENFSSAASLSFSNKDTLVIANFEINKNTVRVYASDMGSSYSNHAGQAVIRISEDSVIDNLTAEHGTSITLEATDTNTEDHKSFRGWANSSSVSSTIISTENPYTFDLDAVSNNATQNFYALFATDSFNVAVTYNVEQGSVSGDGMHVLSATNTVNLTAEPAYGYEFVNWKDSEGNVLSTALTLDTMSADSNDLAFIAEFRTLPFYVRAVTSDATKGTARTSANTAQYLDSVAFVAEATAEHYHFQRWSNGETEDSIKFPIVSDTSLVAFFVIDTHSVSLIADAANFGTTKINGEDTNFGWFDYGTEGVEIEAVPYTGVSFTQWSDENTDNPRLIDITEDVELTAEFDSINYTIALNVNAVEGTIYNEAEESVNSATARYLDTLTFEAEANTGFKFLRWEDAEGNVYAENPVSYVVTAAEEQSLTAVFGESGKINITLAANVEDGIDTLSVAGHTTVNGTPSDTLYILGDEEHAYNRFDSNTVVTLHAVAAEHYHFVNWMLDGEFYSAEADTTYTATWEWVDEDYVASADFVANFALDTFKVKAIAENGSFTVDGEEFDSAWFDYGTELTIVPVAANHYHFNGWADEYEEVERTMTVVEETVVEALFGIDTHAVTLMVNDELFGTAIVAATDDKEADENGAYWYDYGTDATLVAVANEGYHLVAWSNEATTDTIVLPVYGESEMTANFDTNVYTVTFVAENGTIEGAESVKHFTENTYTASGNYGYHFAAWTMGEDLTDSTIVLNAVSDTTLTATFAKNSYTVTVAANDDEMGEVNGTATVLYKDTVTLTATPAVGYHVAGWSNGMNGDTIRVVADSNMTVTANFAINVYTVTASASDAVRGTVNGAKATEHGALDTLVAVANYGYHFNNWSNGATTETLVLTVVSDTNVVANFDKNQYTATAQVNNQTMGTAAVNNATANYLDTVVFTATANEHYSFVSWSNGATTETVSIVLTQDTVLTATFEAIMHTVSVSVNDATMGSVTPAGDSTVMEGSSFTATATANEGFLFTGWNTGATTESITVTVDSNITLVANFMADTTTPVIPQYTVILTSANSAMGTVSAGGTVDSNTTFTATATATEGNHFVAWLRANDTVSTEAEYTFVVTEDISLVAHFAADETPITHFTVTTEVNDGAMGTVTGGGEYEEGSECVLVAHANAGYRFVRWMNGDQELGTDTIFTFTVSANITITAVFEQNTGIDDVDMSDVTIYSTDSKIIVRGAENQSVYVFDVNGRVVMSEANAAETCEFRMASTGVYLVKVGNAPAKRVLVVR